MISCNYCKGQEFETKADKSQIRFECFGFEKRVVKCVNCGLIQLLPPWSEKELKGLYAKYWQKQDFAGQKRKVKISTYLEKYLCSGDSILEIGCGHGDNLKRLAARGYKVLGLDKDPSVCDGKLILQGDIYDFHPIQKFDFIYGIHLFEHIADPRRFIQWLLEHLNPQGRFLLEMPNVDDPLLTIYKVENFKKFYWYPYHLFFYAPQTLKKLFSEFGRLRTQVKLRQEYGLLNHLRWKIFQRPGNLNFKIPILDALYAFILHRFWGKSDTLIIWGEKE